ncbi:hypothetical protein EDB86DRAFT_3184219 [Lactarius hatsudake]|nr:hypothetical protein EDB86DRAFT_3184219 [Lactarius hatsudake]
MAALQVINPHHDSLLFCDCAETLPAAEIQESLEGICHRRQQRSLKLEVPGWNSLQRAQASGLAVFVALGHDHVLRRNIRIVTASNKLSPFSSFDASTFGFHHTRLANYTAKFWNRVRLSKPGSSPDLLALPEMTAVSSNKTFGLVNSECTTTFGGLFSEVKAAPKTEDPSLLTLSLDEDPDLDLDLQVKRGRVVNEFRIDSSLFNMPMV